MTARIFELMEERPGWFSPAEIREEEVIALSETRQFDIEPASLFNGQKYGIRSRGWVGHIPIGNDLLVRVLPKVSVSNLFRMLEVAYNLRSFRILDGEIGIEAIDDLYERIVSILARRILDRARKGLYRSYVPRAEDLPYVSGRLDAVATILNIGQGNPTLACRYEEHTADVAENRVIAWALHQIRRQTLKLPRIRRELDSARRALGGTITLERYDAADCIGRLYNRLNEDYSPMHGLCRFILEQSGPGIQGGDRTFVPFVLNMPRLFETFVAEWLRQNHPPGIAVRPRYSAVLEANFDLSIRVDILLVDESTDKPLAVLDTKYKTDEQPSEADIYQVAFYAHELGAHRAALIFPMSLVRPFEIQHASDVLLRGLSFDLSKPVEEAGEAFSQALIAFLA